MAKRLVVTVPHHLSVEEARHRLDGRADWAKHRLHREGVRLTIADWRGDHRAFRAVALGQYVNGFVAVAEQSIRFEVEVPWILSVFGPKIEAVAKHYASRLMSS